MIGKTRRSPRRRARSSWPSARGRRVGEGRLPRRGAASPRRACCTCFHAPSSAFAWPSPRRASASSGLISSAFSSSLPGLGVEAPLLRPDPGFDQAVSRRLRRPSLCRPSPSPVRESRTRPGPSRRRLRAADLGVDLLERRDSRATRIFLRPPGVSTSTASFLSRACPSMTAPASSVDAEDQQAALLARENAGARGDRRQQEHERARAKVELHRVDFPGQAYLRTAGDAADPEVGVLRLGLFPVPVSRLHVHGADVDTSRRGRRGATSRPRACSGR